ncbi:MAG: response regulator transcription factor [Clostridia bacterium]|nr:response regulator transcription factor [Clostridia bacterium]
MSTILVVEDNPNQRRILSVFLKGEGYGVEDAESADEALKVLERKKIDMAICDVMLPGMDGFRLTEELRSFDPDLPILITTAKGEMEDKEKGFLAGTDDYMVKPIDLNELLLRMRALFRRAKIQTEKSVEIAGAVIDSRDASVKYCGNAIFLKRREFQLLFMLASNSGIILTRRQLMDGVWGVDCETDERTVDVHVKRVREKLKNVDAFSIETVRGLGYRLEVSHAQP